MLQRSSYPIRFLCVPEQDVGSVLKVEVLVISHFNVCFGSDADIACLCRPHEVEEDRGSPNWIKNHKLTAVTRGSTRRPADSRRRDRLPGFVQSHRPCRKHACD